MHIATSAYATAGEPDSYPGDAPETRGTSKPGAARNSRWPASNRAGYRLSRRISPSSFTSATMKRAA